MVLRSIKQRAHRTSAVGETAGDGGWPYDLEKYQTKSSQNLGSG